MTNNDKDIIIYSTPTCGYCQKAKQFFKENNIEYTEYDVSEDKQKRRKMVDKSGQMGVPVITVNEETMVGFDESKLRNKLEIQA